MMCFSVGKPVSGILYCYEEAGQAESCQGKNLPFSKWGAIQSRHRQLRFINHGVYYFSWQFKHSVERGDEVGRQYRTGLFQITVSRG